ncbi:hypothetical protein XH98_08580 [Bradyrhizobium sp. CCBAU 51745]|nr:hypothetical protein [Bradyrhizobium sp. CCBAU 51745]
MLCIGSVTIKRSDHAFQDFVDAIELARNEVEFERTAARTAVRLGFRWFAYLSRAAQRLVSSYPDRGQAAISICTINTCRRRHV